MREVLVLRGEAYRASREVLLEQDAGEGHHVPVEHKLHLVVREAEALVGERILLVVVDEVEDRFGLVPNDCVPQHYLAQRVSIGLVFRDKIAEQLLDVPVEYRSEVTAKIESQKTLLIQSCMSWLVQSPHSDGGVYLKIDGG